MRMLAFEIGEEEVRLPLYNGVVQSQQATSDDETYDASKQF